MNIFNEYFRDKKENLDFMSLLNIIITVVIIIVIIINIIIIIIITAHIINYSLTIEYKK